MKLSQYNKKFNIGNKNIIYNTLTRKYVIYDKDKEKFVGDLLCNMNKNKYSINEINTLNKLMKNGIVIDDSFDELDEVKILFNKTKYQDRRFIMVISPTLDCNFKCPYCFEKRRKTYISDEVVDNITNFVKAISKEVKNLQVGWFGGEPLMMFDKIKSMTETFKDICDSEGCNYCTTITTNGYLLNDERIKELKKFNIKRIQITLDGPKNIHNKKRPLADGSGSFDRIVENINKLLDNNINLVLRINVDENNAPYIHELFDIIPLEKREKVAINMCNIFQSKEYVNLYPLYKEAINKGFMFHFSRRQFQICEGSFVNSITIQPDGKISPCQMCNERGFNLGHISKDGEVILDNKTEYYKFRATSSLESKECIKCNKFPICLGGATMTDIRIIITSVLKNVMESKIFGSLLN